MAARVIDGGKIARKKRDEAAAGAARLKARGITPCLGVILVGDDPASLSYVRGKERALEEAGMTGRDIRLPRDVTEEKLLGIIKELNADRLVHGILVQLPLPPHIREDRVITALDPAKDVDGFHPVSAGNLVLGRRGFLPCTPRGILALLEEMKIPTAGAHAVVVGRSNLVGRPLANLLTRRDLNATLTVCHTGTVDLGSYTRQGDILIAAAGKAGLITADMVKDGAVVIDVGVNRVPVPGGENAAAGAYRLRGDVDFEGVSKKASYITPVPGGVGPMTIAMLLLNLLRAAEDLCAPAPAP
ncbi:MAG: bifunctional 5,10-methylene-tetrahydrofolate dehydrogenase/5,10-methylene-tetrahydrofolate cyclohydrolase [Spirochaetaceae bacterium]|jgi:methylenetetrahydrofolate dehydrogenase (NADP+)/methenyltetrahydrofolate cyclohydrolase|nr:bifunctional 5,10-methylene-tetrahydrofolate dehydrogenase/5,10-methylene-tetrahydrofolate cyclohydrolase [Spirochaetaceae bacterium]